VVLVDTSFWIRELQRSPNFDQIAPLAEIATCPPVIQEVLQGIRLETAYRTARDIFLSLHIFESPMSIQVFEEGAQIYRTGRALGVTIRSSVDCLIAACAIRNGLPILHSDRDFDAIARFTPLQSRYVR
jgi:predicted nucleic acid-binding protein